MVVRAKTDQTGKFLTSSGETTRFAVVEFACRCGCGLAAPSQELIDALHILREWVGVPIHVLSGTRCFEHNKSVDGKPASRHLPRDPASGVIIQASGPGPGVSDAADIVTSIHSPRQLLQKTQIRDLRDAIRGRGLYRSFIHVDTRPGHQAYWEG